MRSLSPAISRAAAPPRSRRTSVESEPGGHSASVVGPSVILRLPVASEASASLSQVPDDLLQSATTETEPSPPRSSVYLEGLSGTASVSSEYWLPPHSQEPERTGSEPPPPPQPASARPTTIPTATG